LENISEGSWRLLELWRLKKAGFPFSQDDLDYVCWQLLGVWEEKIEQLKGKKPGFESIKD